MNEVSINERGLFLQRGGSGSHLIVLLHGIAANSAVWSRFIPLLRDLDTTWIAPDFRGHGRSVYSGPYGYGDHAADIAALLHREKRDSVTVIGHSFGGVVAALLGTGLFGVSVQRVIGLGIKQHWTSGDVAAAGAAARRPSTVFENREEAVARYLKVSGLVGLCDPSSGEASHGIVEASNGFSLAVDPAVFSAVGPSITEILSHVCVPLVLAVGSEDAIAYRGDAQDEHPLTTVLPGLGHNSHVQRPESLVQLLNLGLSV